MPVLNAGEAPALSLRDGTRMSYSQPVQIRQAVLRIIHSRLKTRAIAKVITCVGRGQVQQMSRKTTMGPTYGIGGRGEWI
jgi:hypothetical protein